MLNDNIPPILRLIIEDANRPRSKEEDEAARRFVLGSGNIAEYMTAKHNAKIGQARKSR
jgi:hypothetical protein